MLGYNEARSQGEHSQISDFKLLIDGKMVPGDQTMPVLNPATEERRPASGVRTTR